jgi:bifunctional non-homologous end joining protein LigD
MKPAVPPVFSPVRLATLPTAFDHSDFIFELKYDGFRAVAHIDGDGVRLASRKGNVYKSFPRLAAGIAEALHRRSIVLDGEIIHFDPDGRPQFYELLRRRSPQHFCAFDLLAVDGRDLRNQPLIERKRLLKALVPPQPCPVIYVDHIDETGEMLFSHCCQLNLEGIVAKYKYGLYEMEGPFPVGRE